MSKNQPPLEVISKQDVRVEVYKGLVIAFSFGALLFYSFLFPPPFMSLGDDEQQPLRSDISLNLHSSCELTNMPPASSVSWGRRANSEARNVTAYTFDDGNNLKLYVGHPTNCTTSGYHFIKTLPGRGSNPDVSSYPVIGDTNSNGNSEIIVSTEDRVVAYNMSGDTVWTFTPESQYGSVNYSQPMLMNFWPNHQGLETVVSTMNSGVLYIHRIQGGGANPGARIGMPITVSDAISLNSYAMSDIFYDYWPHTVVVKTGYINIYDKNGSMLLSAPSGTSSTESTPPLLKHGDYSDGYIFVGYNEGSNTVIRGWRFWDMYRYFDPISSNFPITVSGNIMTDEDHSLVFANLTDNSDPDIVFLTDDGQLHAYTFQGDVIPGFPIEVPDGLNGSSQPIAANLDPDTYDEIILPVINGTRMYFYDYEPGNSIEVYELLSDYDLDYDTVMYPATVNYYNNSIHLSVPTANHTNDGVVHQYSIEGSSGNQPNWMSVGGTMQKSYSYGLCDGGVSYGDCKYAYGSSNTATYCNGGELQSNCNMCGCTGGYYCESSTGYCRNQNPPEGGSPVMLKAPEWMLELMRQYCDTHPDDPLCQGIQY